MFVCGFSFALVIWNVRYKKMAVPKLVDHEAMRDTLAGRCVEAFAERGYGRSSMRTLAQAADTSTGTLYHYFPNKSALFQHVVERVASQDIAEATQLLIAAYDDPAERIRPLMQFVVAATPRLAEHFRVLNEFAIHPDNPGEVWSALMAESRGRYLAALRDALEVEDEARLDMVLLTICGMVLRAMCGDPASTDLDAVVAQLERILR